MRKNLLLAFFIAFYSLSVAGTPLAGGTYTIGGNSPSFPTVKIAVDSLNVKGIAGNVIFKIRPGFYNEQFSIQNFQKNLPSDSVIFESESGNNDVIVHHIEDGTNNYVVELNGCSGVSFRNMTFNSSGNPTEYGIVKILTNGNKIHFIGDKFIADKTQSPGNLIESTSSVDNLSIMFCYFHGGATAIAITGSIQSKGISVIGNTFRNQSTNTVYFNLCKELNFSKNDVECSQGYALSCSQIESAALVSNKIKSAAGGISFNFVNSNLLINPVKIYNNRISALTGMYIKSSDGIKIFHNSIISSSANSGDAAIKLELLDSMEIKNNLIMNPAGNAMHYNNPLPKYMTIDNNCYLSSATIFTVAPNSINLLQWQGNTGFDGQSITCTIPKFVNKDSTLLKLIPGNFGQLRSTLDLSAFVSLDFEGQLRSTVNPFYGADEYIYAGAPRSYLTGTITYGNDTVRAGRIMLYADSSNNKRFDMITSSFIDNSGRYEMNNFIRRNYILKVIPDSLQYPNLIPTYFGGHYAWDSATVFLPDSNMFTIKNVDLIQLATTTGAYGKISGYVYEDGTKKTNDPIPGLDIILDKIPPASSVQKTQTDVNGYYEFTGLSTGDYTVKMDIAGLEKDSLYSVSITGNDTVLDGLNYCVDSAIYTCEGGTQVKEIQKKEESISIFPNPFSDYVSLVLPNENVIYAIQVYDVLGNQVITKTVNGGLLELNTGELQSGIYFIKVHSDKAVISENKLIKK